MIISAVEAICTVPGLEYWLSQYCLPQLLIFTKPCPHPLILHLRLRQPLASRGSAKSRASSNHGEPTPLALASRCGCVGPLLYPGECTMTLDPPEYGGARGSRPQDVGVSSLRSHSQRPTKGTRRQRTMSRLPTGPPRLTKQLRRADKARGKGLPRQTQEQQRRGPWTDGQISNEKTTPVEQWPDRSTSSLRREGKRGGVGFLPKNIVGDSLIRSI